MFEHNRKEGVGKLTAARHWSVWIRMFSVMFEGA